MSHTDDLTSDARWPIYGPGAAALGFRSELAVRVLDDPSASIAINLYSRERAAFRHPEEAARVLVGYAHGVLLRRLRTARRSRDGQRWDQVVPSQCSRTGRVDENWPLKPTDQTLPGEAALTA